MKKSKTIATRILLSVFGVVLLSCAISFSAGFLIVKDENEKAYTKENAAIVDNLSLRFDSGLLDTVFDETYSIYEANAPLIRLSEMTAEDRDAYYNKFLDIYSRKDTDGINYHATYNVLFTGSAISAGANAINIGFVDKKRNRFVTVFSYQEIKTDGGAEEWPSVGAYFDLPDPLKGDSTQLSSYDGERYRRNNTGLFGTGRKLSYLSSEDCWILLDQKTSVVEEEVRRFTINFAVIVAAIAAVLLVALYFLLKHYAITPARKLSLIAREYTASIKEGNLKPVFRKSIGRPDEIDDLNDSFYYLDQELREYVRKVKSAATSEEKMHAELNLAQDIQLSSLPKGFIHDETLSLYANMNPAKEVGGDLYGFADLPGGKLYIFVGDVSGKGIPAALFMMQAKTILQETLSEKDLLAAVTNTNEHLLKEGSADLFLTAFIAVLDKNTGLLQYVNAGHEPIFVCHFGQYSKLKEEADVPLATLEGYEFHLQSLQLDPGDRIFAYTDGISESMSRNGVLYGKRKIEEVLNSLAGAEDKDLIEGMNGSLAKHSSGREQSDDICMLSLSYRKGRELLVSE